MPHPSDLLPRITKPTSKKVSGIYIIFCIPNQRAYFGSSIDIRKRLSSHKSSLRRGAHCSVKLQNSFDKYGESAFIYGIVELSNTKDQQELLVLENKYLLMYDKEHLLNVAIPAVLTPGGGRITPQETREKIKKAITGIKRTPEQIQRMREAKANPSQETRDKISKRRLGKRMSDECKEHLSAFHHGRQFSDEHKEKISAALRGKKMNPDSKARMIATQKAKEKVGFSVEESRRVVDLLKTKTTRQVAEIYGVCHTTIRRVRDTFMHRRSETLPTTE